MNSGSRRITLKDVAAILDVSTATVSNAFNRPNQLSATLRERVLAEAARLGYSGPDAKARTLRTGRSRIISVILAESLTYSLNDAVASALLAGLAEVLDEQDYTMMLLAGRDRPAHALNRASIADGFVIYGLMPNPQQLRELLRPERQPVVTIDLDIPGYPSIHVDNENTSYKLACHALAHRPQRVAILALRLTSAYCNGRIPADAEYLPAARSITRLRLAGFERALGEQAADVPITLWNIEENVFDVCAPVVADMLDLPEDQRPDLVLCMSDRIALTVITLAEQRGIRIPQDMRVTGFDGIAEGQYRSPTLTTAYQDSTEKGRRAGAMVLQPEAIDRTWLPAELWIGESCP